MLSFFSIFWSIISHFESFETSQPFVCLFSWLLFWINVFFFSAGLISFCSKAGCSHSFPTLALNKLHLLDTEVKPQSHAAINMTLLTLSYVPARLCPKDRPSCADTITLLISERGRKDSRVLASQSRLWGSGSLQQRSAGTQHPGQHYLLPVLNANRLFTADKKIFLRFNCSNLHAKYTINI